MDSGLKLLEILRKQRTCFIRLADGTKMITNPILYNALEDESLRLQKLCGRQNMREGLKSDAHRFRKTRNY
jgi:hypothetical protein